MKADVVIDVGCARYGDNYSIERLVDEFSPTVLHGFDPNEVEHLSAVDGTGVVIHRAAAWTYDGEIGYTKPGMLGRVSGWGGMVPCVDLAKFIRDLKTDEIVLKVDVEGGEYDLLRHLTNAGVDHLLALAWIEWHEPDDGRKEIKQRLRCPTAEWLW